MRQHMWFFALEDCNRKFYEAFPKKASKARLLVDFHITNTNESEFTSEDDGIGVILAVLCGFNFLFLIITFMKIKREYNTHDTWDKSLLFLFSAMAIEAFHLIFSLGHTLSYANDGIGLPALSVIGDILEVHHLS